MPVVFSLTARGLLVFLLTINTACVASESDEVPDAKAFRDAMAALKPGESIQYGEPLAAFLPARWRGHQSSPEMQYGDGVNGAPSVIDSWNSAVTINDKSGIAFYGGGGKDGGYTAFYVLSMIDGTWSRMGQEYPYTRDGDGVCTYPEDGPRPPHTYDGLVNAGGEIFVGGKYSFCRSDHPKKAEGTWVFDVASEHWTNYGALAPNFLVSAYDPKRHLVYTGSQVVDAWRKVEVAAYKTPRASNQFYKGMSFDGQRNRLWYWFGDGNVPFELYYTELDDQGLPTGWVETASSMPNPSNRVGMDWGPAGKLYMWDGEDDVRVYTPETDDWSTIQAFHFTKKVRQGGIFGRWNYIPQLGVFVGVRAFSEPPVYWRPKAVDTAADQKPE
jgi:hypothetical protein